MKPLKDYTAADLKEIAIEELSNCNDLELIIVKGHIIIEFVLNHFLHSYFSKADELENCKLGFTQKVSLIKAIGVNLDEVSEMINLVTKLRNDISHRLTYNKRHLSTLINLGAKEYPPIKQLAKEGNRPATIAVLAYIGGVVTRKLEIALARK